MLGLQSAVMSILLGNRIFYGNVMESFQALSGGSTILRFLAAVQRVCVNVVETKLYLSSPPWTDKNIDRERGFILPKNRSDIFNNKQSLQRLQVV